MKHLNVIAALLSVAVLTACGGAEAKPNSYWNSHPEEALARLGECKANADKVNQQVATALMQHPDSTTKMLDSLPANVRECVYLTGEFRADKARRKIDGS